MNLLPTQTILHTVRKGDEPAFRVGDVVTLRPKHADWMTTYDAVCAVAGGGAGGQEAMQLWPTCRGGN